MAAYRLTDLNPVYPNLLGTASAPDGSLTFYEIGTTTPKDTWSDPAMGVPNLNPNPVELNADGRAETEIFLDGEYTVVLKDSTGTTIWTRDAMPAVAPGLSLPALTLTAPVLTHDGVNVLWEERLQLPDPAGSAGYQVVVNGDGTDYIVQAIAEPPEPPAPEYDVAAGSIRIGTLLIQWGSDTVPAASGAQTANKAVTFGTAFSATPYVVTPTLSNSGGSTSSGRFAALSATSLSTTGCTVTANVGEDDTQSQYKLGNTTPFTYIAIGPTVAP
jgi:hypothetical protein